MFAEFPLYVFSGVKIPRIPLTVNHRDFYEKYIKQAGRPALMVKKRNERNRTKPYDNDKRQS